jgi:hypothetical protein
MSNEFNLPEMTLSESIIRLLGEGREAEEKRKAAEDRPQHQQNGQRDKPPEVPVTHSGGARPAWESSRWLHNAPYQPGQYRPGRHQRQNLAAELGPLELLFEWANSQNKVIPTVDERFFDDPYRRARTRRAEVGAKIPLGGGEINPHGYINRQTITPPALLRQQPTTHTNTSAGAGINFRGGIEGGEVGGGVNIQGAGPSRHSSIYSDLTLHDLLGLKDTTQVGGGVNFTPYDKPDVFANFNLRIPF